MHSGAGSFFDDAILQSPNMTKTGTGCVVSFYYHMYTVLTAGFTGSLHLKLKYKGTTSDLFQTNGNKGDKWNRVEVGLGALDTGSCVIVKFSG